MARNTVYIVDELNVNSDTRNLSKICKVDSMINNIQYSL